MASDKSTEQHVQTVIGALVVIGIAWLGNGVSDLKIAVARLEAQNQVSIGDHDKIKELEYRVTQLEGVDNAPIHKSRNPRPYR